MTIRATSVYTLRALLLHDPSIVLVHTDNGQRYRWAYILGLNLGPNSGPNSPANADCLLRATS